MRRLELIAGTAALGVAAALQPARAATATVTTQLQWIKDSQNAGWFVAEANGTFRAQGIESVTLAGGPNLASVEAIVAAGRADVGMDNLERILDANAAGTDFVIFAALYQKSPVAFLSLPAHPVRTAKDFIGKRVGLQQGGKIFLDAILTVNHLKPDYTEVVVGSTPDPLLQGACDAYLCFITNQPLLLAARNIPSVVATFDQLGYNSYVDCLFCTREYLKANRATLVRYVRALQRGWQTCISDPATAAKVTVANDGASLGLDERKEFATSKAMAPLLHDASTSAHGLLWVDTARVAGPIYTTMRATGRTKLPPADTLVDTSIVAEAMRR
jgi:ABC-type nitrate/sulfonate/bicarbonate transport system substrate-binding protein